MAGFFGFFNTKSSLNFGLQVVNLAAFGLAAYELYQNPDRLAKAGLDMAVHAFNFICLRENVSAVESLLNVAANCMQVGALYTGSTASCARFEQPLAVSAVDTVVHLGTAATVFWSDMEEQPSTTPKMA